MQWHLTRGKRREHPARYGIPGVLQGVGIAVVLIFLLWAVAMVLMQAWQAIQPHAK